MNEKLPEIEMEVEFEGEMVVGKDGATFIPSVDAEGNLSWSNDGDLPNPEPVNIKGKDGYTPIKGVDYFTEAEKAEMLGPVATLAETAKSTADSANTRAREALANADEALSLADDAYDTAQAAMEAIDNISMSTLTINGVSYNGSAVVDMTETVNAMIDAKIAARSLPKFDGTVVIT